MAVIKPFRGVRYNPDRILNMSAVVSQPYDRIGDELEQAYYALSPYNITRIILGHDEDSHLPTNFRDGDGYTKAKETYLQWLESGVLYRDEKPALYAYEQTFTVDGQTFTRLGMTAALELAEFDEGIVLPHERTHSGPKADRLRLMEAMAVNTEQIFMLYPDPHNRINAVLREAIAGCEPDVEATEHYENEVRQRMWVIQDEATIDAIQAIMAPMESLIIADGHHRYETALNYRNSQRKMYPDLPADAALNYVGVTLVSMDDPGMVVLPTHREIRNFEDTDAATIIERASAHFNVNQAADLDTCLATINAHAEGHAFGLYSKDTGYHILTLKDEVQVDDLITADRSPDWKSLAVTILHRVLLEQIAEVPTQGIEDKTMVHYHRNAADAVANVDAGEGRFVFFVSPTSIAQIKACAAQGEKMPQKSTDFYPKMISGLVMLPIRPSELLNRAALLPVDSAAFRV